MDRRDFCLSTLGLLAGCGGDMEYQIQPSPSLRTSKSVYESGVEGRWIPSVGGTATYTDQSGTYTKFGTLVFIQFRMVIATIGTGNTNDISGLPFTSNGYATFSVFWTAATNPIVYAVGTIDTGTTVIGIKSITAASTSLGTTGLLKDSTQIIASGFYRCVA